MTPFDINPDNDAGHTIDQDDLIAFHLHELSSPQERALHRVLRTNPALQAESIAIASTLRAFPKQEPALSLDAAALDRHWQALRNSLPTLVPAAILIRSLFPRWVFPTLAATALAATAVILTLHHTPHTTVATTTHNVTSPSNSISPISSVQPVEAVPTSNSVQLSESVPPASIPHPLFHHAVAQPHPTSASISPSPLPTPPSTRPALDRPPAAATSARIVAPGTTNFSAPNQPAISGDTFTAATHDTSVATSLSPARRTSPSIHHPHPADFTLAIFGNFTAGNSSSSTSGTGGSSVTQTLTQTATNAVGALASFHQQVRPWVGYRVTTTYSRPTFEAFSGTSSSAGTFSSGAYPLAQSIYELSGTYSVQGPRHHRLSTSAEAGAGLLAFISANPYLTASTTVHSFHSAAVVGVGSELALTKHWALRADYRVLLYKPPAFYVDKTAPTPGNLTLSSNPIFGITYHFGATGTD